MRIAILVKLFQETNVSDGITFFGQHFLQMLNLNMQWWEYMTYQPS